MLFTDQKARNLLVTVTMVERFCPLSIKDLKKYMLFAGWAVCARGLGYYQRPQARAGSQGRGQSYSR